MNTYGPVTEENDAVTLTFAKDDTAFVIGTAVLQPNPDTSGNCMCRLMHRSLLRNGSGVVWDLVLVRMMVIDKKWYGTLHPYGFGRMKPPTTH